MSLNWKDILKNIQTVEKLFNELCGISFPLIEEHFLIQLMNFSEQETGGGSSFPSSGTALWVASLPTAGLFSQCVLSSLGNAVVI